ncbi:hypothetical protein ACQ4PT_014372 [Festuca glaucescens]
MEGLIKGLAKAAIDALDGGDDEAPRRQRPAEDGEEEGREDRDRSTWAEVVSDKKGGEPEEERRGSRPSRQGEGWERADGRKQQQQQHTSAHGGGQSQYEGDDRRDGGSRLPQQQAPANWSQQQSEAWNAYKRPPSEQEYSEDAGRIHQGLNLEPTREELNSLSEACGRLWELDMNRLVPGKDYRIDCGEGKKVYQKDDMAYGNLFSWLGDDVFTKPTYSRFCALLDNYNPHQGYKEVVTQQEKHEEVAFIEEIARTAPIKYLHQYLVMKGVASQDYDDFKTMLSSLWFNLYGRCGNSSCSSAFEHVFVGEIKGERQGENEVSGFHNWIQFYLEEAKGNVDYKGYIFPRRRGESPDSETQLLTVQFEWHGVLKSVSSSLIGVSPEFELALYTLCFYMGGEDNRVNIGPYTVNVKCYRMVDLLRVYLEDESWERADGRKQQQHGGGQSQHEGDDRRGGGSRLPQQQAPANRRQQQVYFCSAEGEETDDGGWETVGEKKKHGRPQQSEAWNAYKRPPSEQEYSEDAGRIHQGLNLEPTREELNSLSEACSRLWELDMNRLVPGKDYRIDCGEGKKVYQKDDMAYGNLFSWLGDDVFTKPTYSRFYVLLDNYNPHQGYKEVVTQQEKHEEVAFIEEIARTVPIKYLHQYLVMKGVASQDYDDFKTMLSSLWFNLYGRCGNSSCSSAFEHVFVGEIKGERQGENEVSGFHNWIQFYLEEAKGNVDYKGYIFPRRRGESPDSETQLLTVQFEWHGVLKSVSSSLIGVSPEFELALYTLCFYIGGEDNRVNIGPYTVNVKCYRMGNNKIGSAFPIAEN